VPPPKLAGWGAGIHWLKKDSHGVIPRHNIACWDGGCMQSFQNAAAAFKVLA
jgi:hypothetical protein